MFTMVKILSTLNVSKKLNLIIYTSSSKEIINANKKTRENIFLLVFVENAMCFKKKAVFFKIVVTVFMLGRLLHWQLFFRVQCRRSIRVAVPDGALTPA